MRFSAFPLSLLGRFTLCLVEFCYRFVACLLAEWWYLVMMVLCVLACPTFFFAIPKSYKTLGRHVWRVFELEISYSREIIQVLRQSSLVFPCFSFRISVS